MHKLYKSSYASQQAVLSSIYRWLRETWSLYSLSDETGVMVITEIVMHFQLHVLSQQWVLYTHLKDLFNELHMEFTIKNFVHNQLQKKIFRKRFGQNFSRALSRRPFFPSIYFRHNFLVDYRRDYLLLFHSTNLSQTN